MNNVNDKDMNENTRSSLCSCNSEESFNSRENQEQAYGTNTEHQKLEEKHGMSIRNSNLGMSEKEIIKQGILRIVKCLL